MRTLPSGTVTLLFSDMEGSTMLLNRLGERYVDALDAQRRILRGVWAECDGTELGTEGDSFYVVFGAADQAVRAVALGQRALAQHTWPDEVSVRVRMGLHSGAPVPHDGAYVGIDVHRAARIAASAHGGQIVCSDSTAALVADAMPAGVALRDLGEHRFKHLERPEHVFQLEVHGLDQTFPPLRSLGTATNLPVPDAALLGRDDVLAQLSGWFRRGRTRLLTLTGPGGTGKTALAIELARSLVDVYSAGVYFVALASVVDESEAWGAVADAVGLGDEREPEDVIAHISGRRMLVVLDNLEQIAQASKLVHRLVSQAETAAILATSRRPLHLASEQEFPVASLAVPSADAGSAAADAPAVRLFERRAQRVRPSFRVTDASVDDVVAICRRVDGVPLAIELAAARSKLLSPAAILARLGSALDLVSSDRDRPDRHHSLRDTVEWSYRLLSPEHQRFFRRLGVFAAGADLDSVSAVCTSPEDGPIDPLDLVVELVDASLVQVSDGADGEPRVTMLETIRSYAEELLDASDESERIRERHARHLAHVVGVASVQLTSSDFQPARATFAREHVDIVAALDWWLSNDATLLDEETFEIVLRMAGDVGRYWWTVGRLADSIRVPQRTVDWAGARTHPELAACLTALSNNLRLHGENARGLELAERALAMLRQFPAPQPGMPGVLRTLSAAVTTFGRLQEAADLLEQAAAEARDNGDTMQLGRCLSELGGVLSNFGDLTRARQVEEEAIAIHEQIGDVRSVVSGRQNLACTLRLSGDLVAAEAMMRAVISSSVAMYDDSELVYLVDDYAALLAELGNDVQAARLLGAADACYADEDMDRPKAQEAEIGPAIVAARGRLSTAAWDAAYKLGRAEPMTVVLLEALRATSSPDEAPPA